MTSTEISSIWLSQCGHVRQSEEGGEFPHKSRGISWLINTSIYAHSSHLASTFDIYGNAIDSLCRLKIWPNRASWQMQIFERKSSRNIRRIRNSWRMEIRLTERNMHPMREFFTKFEDIEVPSSLLFSRFIVARFGYIFYSFHIRIV